MKAIILFSGKMQSGKNLAASLFQSVSDFSTREFSFANSLKKMSYDVFEPINRLFGYTYDNYTENKTDITRALLNSLGTNLFQNTINKKNYWAECVVNDLKEYEYASNIIGLITDLRYEHELETVRKYCYEKNIPIYTVRINRKQSQKKHSKVLETHDSNTSMDNYECFSYTIENNATVESFKKNIIKMYNDIITDIEGQS